MVLSKSPFVPPVPSLQTRNNLSGLSSDRLASQKQDTLSVKDKAIQTIRALSLVIYMKRHEMLYLSTADVERVGLPMKSVIKAVEDVFREKGEGRTEMPPKPGIHTMEDSFIHAMPAYVASMKAAGMKWVSGYPDNRNRGLPYISGLLILNDPKTGLPLCVMDCTWVTAKRTGAATAVAAKYLARRDSRTLGVLGCGVQGRTNVEALKVIFPRLEEVRAYDIDAEALRRYAKHVEAVHGICVKKASTPKEAVVGSDLVVTAGPILKRPKPVIEASWFTEGAFACPLDFDSYWKPSAMNCSDKFCTDDRSQLEYYKTVGYFGGIPNVYADLGEIVTGRRKGRETTEERIMSMNLGVAIEDMATSVRIFKLAEKKDIGRWLPL
jgi:ornithine cyclodeaminase/alanine dehydrogenase-like protein (mu-crystallin family)